MITADPVVRRHVYHDNSGICHICGEFVSFADMHIDHVIPSSHGGSDELGNLRPSHAHCNRQKGSWYNGVHAMSLPHPQSGPCMDGVKVRALRKKARLTLHGLAEQSGVSYVTLHRIEKASGREAYPSTIRKIADALGVAPVDLMSEASDE